MGSVWPEPRLRQLHAPYVMRLAARAKRVADKNLLWVTEGALVVLARPLLRAAIGRWPQPGELGAFRRGFRAPGAGLPRLLAGLAQVEAARPALAGATERAFGGAAAAGRLPRIAFMHLEKAAGSSVLWYLESLYPAHRIAPRPAEGDADTEAVRTDPRLAEYGLLRGHFALPFLRGLEPRFFLLSFLREPRERILSTYYYWRSHRDSAAGGAGVNLAAAAAARLGLLDFLRCELAEVRASIDNFYVRRFGGLGDGWAGDPDAALNLALAGLGALDFVGIAEEMAASLALLAARLGVAAPAAVPHINDGMGNARALPVQFRPVVRETVTAEIAAELDRLTRLDQVIYAAGRRRFDAEAKGEEFPPPAKDEFDQPHDRRDQGR